MNFLTKRSSTILQLVTMQLLLLLSANCIAYTRHWVAATTSNWSSMANWSNTEGGAGGFSVPTMGDNAVFNAGGQGNCNVDVDVNLARFGVNEYTGTIDLAGYSITIAASTSSPVFDTGTINDTPGTGQLNITTSGKIFFSGTKFGAQVNMSAGDFNFGASTFNATSTFTKTGTTAVLADGGCTFNGITTITNSGTGDLYLSTYDSDIFNDDITFISSAGNILIATGNDGAAFNGNVYVESSSISNIQIGDPNPLAGISTLASGKVIAVGGGGFTSGSLILEKFTQLGTTSQVLTMGGTGTVQINSGCTWNGDIAVTAPKIVVNGSTFNGSATFTKSNNATDSYSDGGNTFNGTVYIENANSPGNLSISISYPNTYNDHVTFTTSGAGTGIIYVAVVPGNIFKGNLTIDSPTNRVEFFSFGSVIMQGTTAQSINVVGATPEPAFYDLKIDNAVSEITLNTPVTITNSLTLTQGNIISNSTDLITLNDGVTVTGMSDASFVQGPIKKIGDNAFIFPVGNDDNYQPIAIDAPGSITDAFIAEYIRADPDPTYDKTSRDGTLNHISNVEYWTLDRTAGTSDVNVTLAWNDKSGGIDNLTELSVARWDGSSWKDHGNGGFTGNSSAGTIVSSSPVTSFSPFTLASTTMNNPLPIELLFFSAAVIEYDKVQLKWQTASETNNDFFTIERSISGTDWHEIAQVAGAGNSSILLNYTTFDYRPYSGILYYRLLQTDYDGQFSYSKVISIKINNLGNSQVSIYPNPATNHVTIEGTELELNHIRIYNMYGQDIKNNIEILENNQSKKILDLSNLNSGAYIIKTETTTNKMLKQ